jgi:hypothetical protein
VSDLLAVRKGEDVMSTMTGHLRRTILIGVFATLAVASAAGLARADVASDKAGAILVFPKIVVDTSGVLGPPTDTEIQITNASNYPFTSAQCYLINDTSHCEHAPATACTLAGEANPTTRRCAAADTCIQDTCFPAVAETDFRLTLTKRQPVSWKASEPLQVFPCDESDNPCKYDNGGSWWPGVKEDPFVGEIKCIEVDPSTFAPHIGYDPTNNYAGDLKGEATIVSVSDTFVDAREYNAIAIQSVGVDPTDRGDVLAIGGPNPQYNGCPKALLVDSLFDDAPVTTHSGGLTGDVVTDLTFVPCTEDLATQSPSPATLQFTVYNEFEQRFSTSLGFSCFKEVQLSDIDSRPGPFGNAQSIFNYSVQGTLAGQIKIRPVPGAGDDNRVLAISEEFWACDSGPGSACSNDPGTSCTVDTDCGTGNTCVKKCSAATNVNLIPPAVSGPDAGNGDQLSLPSPIP